ncbi:hypothetical protein ADUPG1_009564 [Aduncisulcus paluster]|uniref:CBS domain-containing protein n=1 Tax=Aduncisulcus paluster TaxID=2918883 RepID=A0ABQ5KW07_9EUKA|nr:hypothetical protein ADUPG1_009564 [Aduncisulcus paluster]
MEESADYETQNIKEFLSVYTAYDLMPDSSKLVTLNSKLSMFRAWKVLAENFCTAAAIWDDSEERYTGIFTASDIMIALLSLHDAFVPPPIKTLKRHMKLSKQSSLRIEHDKTTISGDRISKASTSSSFETTTNPSQLIKDQTSSKSIPPKSPLFPNPSSKLHANVVIMLDRVSVHDWKQLPPYKRPLVACTTETDIATAVKFIKSEGVHRLAVFDDEGQLLNVITYRAVCRFLVAKFRLSASLLRKTIAELDIGDSEVVTVRPQSRLRSAVKKLVNHKLSAIPVVNEDGVCVDMISKHDFVFQVLDRSFKNLNRTVESVLSSRPESAEELSTVLMTDSLAHVLKMFAQNNIHRVFIVDDKKSLLGVISLRHLLGILVTCIHAPKKDPHGEVKVVIVQDNELEGDKDIDPIK